MRHRTGLAGGAALGIIGLIAAVIAVPPAAWRTSLGAWAGTVPLALLPLATLGVGTLIGVRVARTSLLGPLAPQLLAGEQYVDDFRSELRIQEPDVVKIFGYTGEVVLNDLIRYADRYNSSLDLYILNRNWEIERLDEDAHNQRIEKLGLRPWDKSGTIKSRVESNVASAIRRTFRYYEHQPILTGAILCSAEGEVKAAYISFLRWKPMPSEGGSQFKSVPACMLKLVPRRSPEQKDYAERILSQFDYEWQIGSSAEDIKGTNHDRIESDE